MGWTYLRRIPGAMTDAEFFAREWGPETAAKIKATATKSGTFYAIYETDAEKETRLVPDANGKVRLCLVVLVKRPSKAADGYNFGYKDMDEFMGPCEAACPARLLDMLSPIKPDATGDTAKWAADWRARCRTNAERTANALKLRDGMTVRLPKPANFVNGANLDTFTVRMVPGRRGRRVARFMNEGTMYRLDRRLREQLTLAN